MTGRHRFLFVIGALAGIALLGTGATADAAAKRKPSAKPAPAPAPAPASVSSFDKDAAVQAISTTDLAKCRATNAEKGEGHVVITFAPAGSASSAVIDKGPWVGTPVAKCLAAQFKKTKVPAFTGEAVTVGKTFKFE